MLYVIDALFDYHPQKQCYRMMTISLPEYSVMLLAPDLSDCSINEGFLGISPSMCKRGIICTIVNQSWKFLA